MFETNETDTISAKRLKGFLNSIPLSLRDLSAITGISQSTFSRIINGSVSFRHDNVITITEVFGITETQFFDSDFKVPDRNVLIKRIKNYLRTTNRDINLNFLIDGKHTTHFVDLYISKGFLHSFKSVNKITIEIEKEFDIKLVSSEITNTLNRRIDQTVQKKLNRTTGLNEFRQIKHL